MQSRKQVAKEFRHEIGDLVEPECPECGGEVVYNGNYFCTDREGCGWAFPHPSDEGRGNSSALCALGVAMYRSLMERRGEEPTPSGLDPKSWRY